MEVVRFCPRCGKQQIIEVKRSTMVPLDKLRNLIRATGRLPPLPIHSCSFCKLEFVVVPVLE